MPILINLLIKLIDFDTYCHTILDGYIPNLVQHFLLNFILFLSTFTKLYYFVNTFSPRSCITSWMSNEIFNQEDPPSSPATFAISESF